MNGKVSNVLLQPDYKAIDETCNHFRVYRDIIDSWESLQDNIKFFGDHSRELANYSGPGHWIDPDQVSTALTY